MLKISLLLLVATLAGCATTGWDTVDDGRYIIQGLKKGEWQDRGEVNYQPMKRVRLTCNVADNVWSENFTEARYINKRTGEITTHDCEDLRINP